MFADPPGFCLDSTFSGSIGVESPGPILLGLFLIGFCLTSDCSVIQLGGVFAAACLFDGSCLFSLLFYFFGVSFHVLV